MQDLLSIYPPTVWMVLLATGILVGVLAGLLGVGGGVVSVPILLDVFAAIGVPQATLTPLAIGTSQACILIASLSAAYAHWRGGTIDRGLVRSWLPALAAGTAMGLVLTPFAPAKVLTGLFAVAAAALAVKMALGNRLVLAHRQPQGAAFHLAPGLVGALSSAVAVGGGTLSTPVLSLFSFPLHRAIGAGALFNLVVALPSTVAFIAAGWGVPGRPGDAIGDVALFCVAAVSLPALFVAPLAARWSKQVPLLLLRRLFALCLGVIAVRLLLFL
ncbi:MAG: sulfite exporter TauE/SafE family protein [Alphaproteobacteria bacterium]|nr:sulfite exporter TauE/SafE family protein [Alphaproteobacteria bacterium]